MKSSGIGGQAVMEGIMMKNKEAYAVAVRKPDKEIAVTCGTFAGLAAGRPFLKLPFVRGIVNLVDSMRLGMRSLSISAGFAEEEELEKPEKQPSFLSRILGDKLEKVVTGATMAVSVLLAIGIFMLLPVWISGLLKNVIGTGFWLALAEGAIRLLIFIGYVGLISLMPDIKRVYMYHGAEHKCINCIEHDLELNVVNAMASSKEHKRCGTSFMLLVMVISVLLFMVIRVDTVWLRMLTRILFIPVIAGFAYEFLRLAGNSNHWLVNLLSRPGLWLQGLTTKEPDEGMIEVAIRAVEAVFDWKAYQEENVPSGSGADGSPS